MNSTDHDKNPWHVKLSSFNCNGKHRTAKEIIFKDLVVSEDKEEYMLTYDEDSDNVICMRI